MNIDLTGQTAVVAGASRGTGLGVTRARTTSGAPVTAWARRSSTGLDKLTAEGTVTALEVDLVNRAAPGEPRTR
jgi:NADP-dependent 3-hydroxy acid dehydrogenase YdfG